MLATVDKGGRVLVGRARLEVKREEPKACCWVTITAASRGEFELTGSDGPGGRKEPRPPIMPPRASPSMLGVMGDMPIAPINIPPPPPLEDTPPIQEGNAPPKPSPGTMELGIDTGMPPIEFTPRPSSPRGR